MSEQTEAVVPAEEEKRGGSTVAKVIGGAAGGVAAGHYTNRYLVNNNIRKALKGDENAKAAEKIDVAVKNALTNDEIAAKQTSLDALNKGIENHELVSKAEFKKVDDKFKFNCEIDGAPHSFDIKAIPKDHVEGVVAADKVEAVIKGEKSYLKTLAKDVEQDLIGSIKASEKMTGLAGGVTKLGLKGKGTVLVATVAGLSVGQWVLNSLFGGKHVSKVSQPAADQQQVRA